MNAADTVPDFLELIFLRKEIKHKERCKSISEYNMIIIPWRKIKQETRIDSEVSVLVPVHGQGRPP